MAKRLLAVLLAVAMLALLGGCGEKRTVHCDGCGKEMFVDAGSNMDEDWIIFCPDCEVDVVD